MVSGLEKIHSIYTKGSLLGAHTTIRTIPEISQKNKNLRKKHTIIFKILAIHPMSRKNEQTSEVCDDVASLSADCCDGVGDTRATAYVPTDDYI